MIKFLFGIMLICGGFHKTLFSDPVWGLYLFAAFTHIRLVQLSENIPLPLNTPIIIASLTLILYLMSPKYERKFNHWPIETWLMGLMVLGMAISSSCAEFSSTESWNYTITFFKYWIFFIMMVNMIDSLQKIEWFHRTLILSSAWLVYRCWDLRGTTGARFENMGGDIIRDGNHYAAALILLFPFVFLKTLSRKKWEAMCSALLCFGIIMAILISGSRGGLLGLAALILLLLFNFKKQRKKIIIPLVFIMIIAAPFMNEFHRERLSNLFSATKEETRDPSAQGRIDSWRLALQLFNEHKLLGVGRGNFKYYSGYLLAGKSRGESGLVTHSLWMEVLSEGGLFLTIPFCSLIYLFFRNTQKIVKKLQDTKRTEIVHYVMTIRTSLAAFFVCATFLNRLDYEPIYWLMALSAILKSLTSRTIADKSESPAKPEVVVAAPLMGPIHNRKPQIG